jgi:hydrogenase maturation protease
MKYDVTDPPLLVIGYGNILRRDDGVGWAAARRLANQLPGELAQVLMVQQLLPELSERLSRCEQAIFIDASAELAPGKIGHQILDPDRDAGDGKTIGHQQSPEGMLRMARDLYGHCPTATLYSIGGSDFSYGCSLSPPVRIALRQVVRDIVETALPMSLEHPEPRLADFGELRACEFLARFFHEGAL